MTNVIEVVEAEAKKVVEEVIAEVKPLGRAARIDATDAERLAVREVEIQYLHALQDSQRIAQAMEQLKARYIAMVKSQTEKYLNDVDKAANYAWSELSAGFELVKKAL